jgi:predicted nucleic acid-binding protein
MPDVISDSSALQYLHRLALLDVLHQYYGTIAVPEAVVREIESGAALGADVPDISTVAWIQVETVSAASLHQVAASLGRGEREVLGLALAKPDPLVILDDADARREARRLSIRFTGILGILLKAKQDGIVGHLCPLLDALQQRGFYLDSATRNQVLQIAGETP